MNTRILMSVSAAFLAIAGLSITFMPQELLAHLGAPADATVVLLIQVLGASYLGLAMLNWMNRGNRIGGIYFRPISMANFFNFAIGGIPLVKTALAQKLVPEIIVLALVYSIFATWFGLVVFTTPVAKE